MQLLKRKIKIEEEMKVQDQMRVDITDGCRVSLRFSDKSKKADLVMNLTREETDKLRRCLI